MTDEASEARAENESKNLAETGPEKKIDPILEGPPLSRREFLYYLWGSSMVIFLGLSGGLALWYALPRFQEGEFGGVFALPVSDVPAPDSGPMEFAEGRFWLVNLGQAAISDPRQPADYPVEPGVRAIYKVCTHLGCLYKWVEVNQRFECPCHGSKFLQTDARIDGPARRNLDQFIIEVVDENGEVLTRSEPTLPVDGPRREGSSVQIPPNAVSLRIDTGRRIDGAPNTAPGGGV